jgi:hypothetical protein
MAHLFCTTGSMRTRRHHVLAMEWQQHGAYYAESFCHLSAGRRSVQSHKFRIVPHRWQKVVDSRMWISNGMVILVVESALNARPASMGGGGRPARRECNFKQRKPCRTLFFLIKVPCMSVEVHVLKSHSHITSNQIGTLPWIYTSTLINGNSSATVLPNNGTNMLKSLTGCWCVIVQWLGLCVVTLRQRKKFCGKSGRKLLKKRERTANLLNVFHVRKCLKL